ncbi:hypothetical protein GCM10010440_09300 [Kitasatospora cinereorecta]
MGGERRFRRDRPRECHEYVARAAFVRATRWAAYRRWITLGVLLIPVLVLALWSHPMVLTALLLVLILLAALAVLALLMATGRAASRVQGPDRPRGSSRERPPRPGAAPHAGEACRSGHSRGEARVESRPTVDDRGPARPFRSHSASV